MDLSSSIDTLAEELRNHARIACDDNNPVMALLEAERRVHDAVRVYDEALFAATRAIGYSNPLYRNDSTGEQAVDDLDENAVTESEQWEVTIRLGLDLEDPAKLEEAALELRRTHGDNRPQEIAQDYAIVALVGEVISPLLLEKASDFGMAVVTENYSASPGSPPAFDPR